MNKQTNIYKNFIFYHLADGRILASMPTVGDMIFENKTEFKAYIDGYLITQEHFKLIEDELRHAVAKHPKFCEGFTDDLTGMFWAEREYNIKARNAQHAPTAESVLLVQVRPEWTSARKWSRYGYKPNRQACYNGEVVVRTLTAFHETKFN